VVNGEITLSNHQAFRGSKNFNTFFLAPGTWLELTQPFEKRHKKEHLNLINGGLMGFNGELMVI
jgi:hypothetical protein